MTERTVDEFFREVDHSNNLIFKPSEQKGVVYQAWEESERGWGVRPDGYSLHLSLEDRIQFIEEYWKLMPNKAPSEYSRPSDYPREIYVSHNIYQQLQEQKQRGVYGLRFFKPLNSIEVMF